MKRICTTLFIELFFALTIFGQVSTYDFPYDYTLKGKSGSKERFTPELHDDSERIKIVLAGLSDSLNTVVRRLTSSYDGLQYLIFDDVYFDNGLVKNETNLQSICFAGERLSNGDWELIDKIRLSNGNILVVASIHHISQIITYIHRFLIYDKTGRFLLSRNDYCILGKPIVLSEINGGFSVFIERDYSPIYIENYITVGHPKVETYADTYRNSLPAICMIRFSKEGKAIAKNSFLVHNDPKVQKDRIMDVSQDSKSNYILIKSNISGVINQPTLAAIVVDRNRPSIFEIQNLHEDNAILGSDGSVLEKDANRIYARLVRSGQRIEIKTRQENISTNQPTTKTASQQTAKTIDDWETKAREKLRIEGEKYRIATEKGDKILSANGITSKCRSYAETPYGIFVGVRLDDMTPMNYIFKNGELSPFPILNSYSIYEYNLKYNALIVGFRDKTIKYQETMSRDFSIYKLETNQLVKQVKYNVDVYRVELSVDQDSLVLYPNLKDIGGVGSSPTRKATKIKL